ncbi:sucrase-isomaltase, intestinal-like [Apostichopus japonicus]|uniref:sucrase-isomaltase, intestinal-like n=1 Tax=Stichopus japonicus TaxID=307972 RepID=UPI003AB3B2A6
MSSIGNKIVWSLLIFTVLAIGVGLGIYFGVREDSTLDPLLTAPFLIREEERIDCYTESGGTPETCASRGCAWSESANSGVPWCFYPPEFGHELVDGPTNTKLGWTATIHRKEGQPSRYGRDIDLVKLEVQKQTNKRLHFKFTDANNERFEVPEELLSIETPANKASSPDYEVEYVESPVFGIRVIRKSTGTVIFNSIVPGFTYEDQFLQITTKLPSKNLYGLGEHNHRQFRHNLNWKRWSIFTRDVAPVDEWNLYGHHPFYMVLEDDGKAHGVLLLNSNAMDVIIQPAPSLTFRPIGGVLDFYIFMGPTPENVVQQYTAAIGRTAMPPYWALGFQLSRWDYGNLTRHKEVVNDLRKHNIPHDVQYTDIDYMYMKRDFTVDPVAYAGLSDWIDELHSRGMRHIPILDHAIGIADDYEAYNTLMDKKAYVSWPGEDRPLVGEVWPGRTVYPDFLHQSGWEWWIEECVNFKNVLDYDALWIDMNEPSNFIRGSEEGCLDNRYNYPPYMPKLLIEENLIYTKTICMDADHHGYQHYNVHSLYGHAMSMATEEALKVVFPTKRSLALTRSSFVGTNKYASHWLGDNQSFFEHIYWSIIGMFEFSLFGFTYTGADICGFWFNTTEEMCQRWMQLGAFYPYARNHNGAGMIPQHPTAFSSEMTRVSRNILNHRYTLLPFMYTVFYEAYVNGNTVIRPLLHEFTSDKTTWNIDRQLLWGPNFLITPVLEEGQTTVRGYFPDQRWYSYYDGKENPESWRASWVLLSAPLYFIPLHVRGGYIIPTQDPALTTVYSRKNPMGLIVPLDDNMEATGRLFWDDGEARDPVDNGVYDLIEFAVSNNRLTMTVTTEEYIPPDELFFDKISVFGLNSKPAFVSIDGVPQQSGDEELYEWNEDTKVLSLTDLKLKMLVNHEITWSDTSPF